MTDPAGGFCSTQDADPTPLRSGDDRSEGEEGKWFVWTPNEIYDVLGDAPDFEGTGADGFIHAYGVTSAGNFEGKNVRATCTFGNATPSGNAMAVTALLKLAGFTNELRYVDITHQVLSQMQSIMSQYPLGLGRWLQALAYALSKPREIALVGEPEGIDTQALLGVVRKGYHPFQVVAPGGTGP